jgi:hypothetical protein
LQREGRGAIADADIFNTGPGEANNPHVTGKALAVNILKKAAASKQNHLLRNRGFGLVLTKQKKTSDDLLINNKSAASESGNSCIDPSVVRTSSEEEPSLAGQSNSLSLLGSYGVDTSDSD